MKLFKFLKKYFFASTLIIGLLKSNDLAIVYEVDNPAKVLYKPEIINNYIKYPDLAKNFSISGTSTMLFVVNQEGGIENITIEKSLGIAFDRQIMDGLKKLSNEILQGSKFSKNNTYRLTIYFKN